MADIPCPVCAEPFDADEWHDWNDKTWDENRAAFMETGCEAMGLTHNESGSDVSMVMDALHDIMGDDFDGMLSGLDDARMYAR